MRIGLETRERVWQQWVNVVYFPHRRSIPGVQDALNEAVVGLQRTAETLQRLVPRHAHNTDNLRSWYKFGTGQKFMRVRDRLKETLASCDAYFESAKLLAETSM